MSSLAVLNTRETKVVARTDHAIQCSGQKGGASNSNRVKTKPNLKLLGKKSVFYICVNYRHSNRPRVINVFPIPVIEESIDELWEQSTLRRWI